MAWKCDSTKPLPAIMRQASAYETIPCEEKEPIVGDCVAGNFRQFLGSKVEACLGPFKSVAGALPVLWSPCAHYMTVCLGTCAIIFYLVGVVIPPDWIRHVCDELQFPEWMGNVLVSSLMVFSCCLTLRTLAARNLLTSEDMDIILNDEQMIQNMTSTRFIPWKSVVMLGGIGCLYFLFPEHTLAMSLYLAPYLIVAGLTSVPTVSVLEGLCDVSKFKTEQLCNKLEQTRANPAMASSDSGFWCDMTQQYLSLDKHLETIWRWNRGGALLLADQALRFAFAIVYAVCAVGAKSQGLIAFCIAGASVAVITMLMELYPLAKVTALCQSRSANKRSIVRLAVKFVNHKDLTLEARGDHSRFLQYVLGTPAGIEIELFGLITESMLLTYAKRLVTIAPVALTYLLRAFGNDNST